MCLCDEIMIVVNLEEQHDRVARLTDMGHS